MALFETLALTFATSLAKHMLSKWLGSSWATEVSQDLVELLRDSAIDKTVSKSDKAKISAIAGGIVGKMDQWVKVELGRLDKPEKRLAIEGVAWTLASGINGKILVDSRLDPDRLWKHLQENHPNATKSFSGEATALYDRLLRECAPRIVARASEIPGFSEAFSQTSLDAYDRIEGTLNHEFNKKEVEEREFERRYRESIIRNLDRMELFGLPRIDALTSSQRLSIAYVRLALVDSSIDRRIAWQSRISQEVAYRIFSGFGTLPITPEATRIAATAALLEEEQLESPATRSTWLWNLWNQAKLHDYPTGFVIRGRAGSGKTTLLQWLAISIAKTEQSAGKDSGNSGVPFFLRLREFVETGFPAPEEFVRLTSPSLAGSMPQGWVHRMLQDGRSLVLIDGMDEVPRNLRNEMLQRLEDLLGSFPHNFYVVTSRPEAVSGELWPEWAAWVKSCKFMELELQDMTPSQVDSLIDNWYRALAGSLSEKQEKQKAISSAEKLKRQLKRRSELRRLTVNPLLCAMVCAVHHERAGNLPSERSRLYKDCVDILLNRRDPGRKIKVAADYPNLGEDQRERLAESVAYWMIRNGLSDASVEDVDLHFAPMLKLMSILDGSGSGVRRFFVERTSLLREPVAGRIDFPHRTLQEYLAGKGAVEENDFGVLLDHAPDDQWRETTIMAVGAARRTERTDFLRNLVAKADSQVDPQIRHQLFLLAVACLEPLVEFDLDARQLVLDRARTLIPPQSREEVQSIAKAANPVVQLLLPNPDYSSEEAAYCVEALAQIGTDSAMQAIASFVVDNRMLVTEAIGKAWDSFDPTEYVNSIIRRCTHLSLNDMPPSEVIDLLPQLESLHLIVEDDADLGGLGRLVQLKELDLQLYHDHITDLSVVNKLSELLKLHLSGAGAIIDFAVQLPKLRQLDIRHCEIADLSPLVGLEELTDILLQYSKARDFSALMRLKNLQRVSIDWEQLQKTNVLENIGHVHHLLLHKDQSSTVDLSALASLKELRSIDLYGLSEETMKLDWLSDLPDLIEVALTRTYMDLEHLPVLPRLTTLIISGEEVKSLELIRAYGAIRKLALVGLRALDLSWVQTLIQVEALDITGSEVQKPDALSELKELQIVALDSDQAQNLKPLAELPRLSKIIVRGPGRIDRASLADRKDITIVRL